MPYRIIGGKLVFFTGEQTGAQGEELDRVLAPAPAPPPPDIIQRTLSRPSAPVVPRISPPASVRTRPEDRGGGQLTFTPGTGAAIAPVPRAQTAPAVLGPGAAQAARFQGITPSSIIPQLPSQQVVPPVPPSFQETIAAAGAFRAGGSPAGLEVERLRQAYEQTGIEPPRSLGEAIERRLPPISAATAPGANVDDLIRQVEAGGRERIVQKREAGEFEGRQFYQGGSEQAALGPVAQAEAFFSGTEGERWQLGGFYRGVNPEDRNPPAFISPFTYRILTQGVEEAFNVPPEFIERLYDFDPVTGFWVRKPGSEDLPIDAGFAGFGNGLGGGFPSFDFGPGPGGTGSGARRGSSMGLVSWRI